MHNEVATSIPLLTDVLHSVLVLGAGTYPMSDLPLPCALISHYATLALVLPSIWPAFRIKSLSITGMCSSRSEELCTHINAQQRNPKYLSHVQLPKNLKATHLLNPELFAAQNVILFVIPTEHLRQTLLDVKSMISESHLLIFANKGIEIQSLAPPVIIIKETLGDSIADRAVFLSGPSFAIEVVDKQPTSVVVASKSLQSAEQAQKLLHSPQFRAYTSTDPIGVEIAGALKNVIAIASGISSGLGFQMNTRAALLTRGLAEITRIGVAMGAQPMTFMGLSGIGDLFLTCTSEKSRNFTVGYRLGKGEHLHAILASSSTAEGVTTAKAAYLLAKKLQVDTPITDEVYGILYEGRSIKDAVHALLRRIGTSE